MKKLIAYFLLSVLSINSFIVVSSLALAQGPGNVPGKPVIELFDEKTNRVIHTSTTSGNASINIKDVQNYSLRITVLPYDVNNYRQQRWKGVVISGSNTTKLFPTGILSPDWERISQNGINEKVHEFKAGSAVVGSYKYVVTYSQDENGQCGGRDLVYCQANLTISFKDSGNSTGGTNQNNNSSGNNGGIFTNNSGGNANTTPPVNPGLNNNQINTGIGVNFNINYDASLGTFFNPLDAESVPELIVRLTRILFVLTGIVAVIVIIIAGFRMVVDNGNETQMAKAKAAITWAVVGLIVSILAFSIVAIIQRIIQT